MPFSFSASTPAEQRQELRSIIAGDIIVSAQAPTATRSATLTR